MQSTLRKELHEHRGLRDQFESLLLNDETGQVKIEAKKFLTKRPSWVKRNPKARIFTLNSLPFDPTTFFTEKGWSIEGQDSRSLALAEFDAASLLFENMINEEDGESQINGEEKILRLKAAKFVRLDARFCRDLLSEPEQKTLEWLYAKRKVNWIDFPGTILRSPSGGRSVLFAYRDGTGWDWHADWLENGWVGQSLSALLASYDA